MPVPRLVLAALCFALVAAGTRLSLRHVESRWQIAALCAAAFAFEFLAPADQPRSYIRALILCSVCAASVLAVKLYTEPQVIPVAIWTAKTEMKHIGRRVRDSFKGSRRGM